LAGLSMAGDDASVEEAAKPKKRGEPSLQERDEMDARAWRSLVLALKHVLKDNKLPMLVNVAWPSVMRVGGFLYSRPGGAVAAGLLVGEEEEAARGPVEVASQISAIDEANAYVLIVIVIELCNG